MTLRTCLIVSPTPQHLTNKDWMRAWRVMGGWCRRGQNEQGEHNRQQGKLETMYAGRLCLSPTNKDTACRKELISTPWANLYMVAKIKETCPPLFGYLVDYFFYSSSSMAHWEQVWGKQYSLLSQLLLSQAKKDISFLKGVRSGRKKPFRFP